MADNLLDLRTIKGFEGAGDTPWVTNLLEHYNITPDTTITGQQYSENLFIKPFQQFNKALGMGLLQEGEKAVNLVGGLLHTPFGFAGDTAEGLYEKLPEKWQSKLSQLMYHSGGSMDAEEFGDQFAGHFLEGIFAFPTLAEFRPIALKHQKLNKPLPKEVIEGVLEKIGTQSNTFSQEVALSYNNKIGNSKKLHSTKQAIDESYLTNLADFYEQATHQPNHPKVISNYNSLIEETLAQYNHMLENGIIPEVYVGTAKNPEPYFSSAHMMNDVATNKKLKFLKTNKNDFPPDHPLNTPSGIVLDGHELLMNDILRLVHDYFGHTQQGFEFGQVGEYNAFLSHSQMYTANAIPALANETLFQNAWVNFNKNIKRKDGSVPKINDVDYIPQNERAFADQKVIVFNNSILKQDKNMVTSDAMIYSKDVTGIDKKLALSDEYKKIQKDTENFGLLESTRQNELMQTASVWERLNKRMEYDLIDAKRINPNVKKNTITLDPEGRVINARFVSGKKDKLANDVYSSAKLNELTDIGLTDYEIKRLAMILADEYGTGYRYFQDNPTHRGFVDAIISESKKGEAEGMHQTLGLNQYSFSTTGGKPNLRKLSNAEIIDILKHETGHLVGNLVNYKTVYQKFLENNPKSNITNEMVSMSKELRPENWANKNQLEYLNKPEELLADSIKMYLINPAKAKKIAPEFSKFLREMINNSKIKNIINLSKAEPNMVKDGLLSQYA